jgi:hypothetical protein
MKDGVSYFARIYRGGGFGRVKKEISYSFNCSFKAEALPVVDG